MKSVKYLFFSIIISLFCLGKHVKANTEGVPETNDLNTKRFALLLQRLELVERRNDEMERKIEVMAADFLKKERTLRNRIVALEKLNNIRDNVEVKDNKHVPGERIDDTADDENVREETRKDAVQKQRRTIKSGSRFQRSVESQVAFFATVTPHDVEHLGTGQNIVFDHSVTNLGNAYHTTHGIFTAPVAGTYVFCATVAGRHYSDGKDYYAHFDVNGQLVSRFITFPDNQATQMIILKLQAGDDVSVKNDRADDHILGDKYTSVSGFLLYQDIGSSENIIGK